MAAAVLLLVVALVVGISGRGDPVASPSLAPDARPPRRRPRRPRRPRCSPASWTAAASSGAPAQCAPQPEQCWGSLTSAFDSLTVATPADCDRSHIYQTFAAGPLASPPIRQSQVDDDAGAKATCTASLVNAMLPEADRRRNWEVYAIPAQTTASDDAYFLCVFGRGTRDAPLTLTAP